MAFGTSKNDVKVESGSPMVVFVAEGKTRIVSQTFEDFMQIAQEALQMALRVRTSSPGTEVERAYLAQHGLECPHCGSLPEGWDWTVENGVAHQEMSCPKCGMSWTDKYMLNEALRAGKSARLHFT